MSGLLKKLDKRTKRSTAGAASGSPRYSGLLKLSEIDSTSAGVAAAAESITSATSGFLGDAPAGITEENPAWQSSAREINPRVAQLITSVLETLEQRPLPPTLSIEETTSEIVRLIRSTDAKHHGSQPPLAHRESEEATRDLLRLMIGVGPMTPLYEDPGVTDIMCDGNLIIRCLRYGQTLETPFRFNSPFEYRFFIRRLLQRSEQTLDAAHPITQFIAHDRWRSRITLIDPSRLHQSEPAISIRVPRIEQASFYELLRTKTLPTSIAAWLSDIITHGGINLLVVGGCGSGKTTMATAILSASPSHERVILMETLAEIAPNTIYVERISTPPSSPLWERAIDLVLHAAPHRVCIGEITSATISAYSRAANAGINTVSTLCVNSAQRGCRALTQLVSSSAAQPPGEVQRQIADQTQLMLVMERIDGKPCLAEISELHYDGERTVPVPLIQYDRESSGKRQWNLLRTSSPLLDRLAHSGIELMPGSGIKLDEALGQQHDTQLSSWRGEQQE